MPPQKLSDDIHKESHDRMTAGKWRVFIILPNMETNASNNKYMCQFYFPFLERNPSLSYKG